MYYSKNYILLQEMEYDRMSISKVYYLIFELDIMNIRPIDNFYKQFSHAHAQNLTNLTTSNILNPIF
jgi:hypothetical protein